MALLITKGFIDLLIIGNQTRPCIFDLSVRRLDKLYDKVIEVDERVMVEGFTEDPEPQPIEAASDPQLVEGLSGEAVGILKTPDSSVIRNDLKQLWDEGYQSLAIALMHSYAYSEHEERVADIAREIGFNIAVSSHLQRMVKIVPRAQLAITDAYLSPITQEYLKSFARGFEGEFKDEKGSNRLLLSQSDGALTSFQKFTGLHAILAGPAGGVVGMARTCWDAKNGTPVLGFNMGGTSTDVSRYGGTFEHVFESTTAEVTIQSPQLDIKTVAAGRGSMLFWQNGLFAVGPDTARACPGGAMGACRYFGEAQKVCRVTGIVSLDGLLFRQCGDIRGGDDFTRRLENDCS